MIPPASAGRAEDARSASPCRGNRENLPCGSRTIAPDLDARAEDLACSFVRPVRSWSNSRVGRCSPRPRSPLTSDWGSRLRRPGHHHEYPGDGRQQLDAVVQLGPLDHQIWDGSITSHSGNQYVITNAGWNATIPAGGSVSFGFNGSPGNVGSDVPTSYMLERRRDRRGPPPSLSINNVTVNDGTAGATAVFTVSLSQAATAAGDRRLRDGRRHRARRHRLHGRRRAP